MAWTWSSTQVDPIAYRTEEQGNIDTPVTELSTNWEFDPAKLDNADVNLSAYGDDSSEQNYNNPNLRGWENDKYRGENTRNTSIEYDPNATIEGLNPNYAYWQKAQMINSSNAGYIQRRNDQIASALYNAGKVSPEDVREFLMQQEWFMNSTENERENTIKSVWKRLWEIAWNNSSNRPQEENKPQPNEEAVNNMKDDLLKSTAWELYGKNTADRNWEDSAIKTLEDANNVQRKVNEQRIRNMGYLQNMDSTSIAASIVSGYTPYWEQAMADLKKYDPTKYAEVQAEVKKMNAQSNINSIASGNGVDATAQTSATSSAINDDIASFAESNAYNSTQYADLTNNIQSSLSSNSVATSASETMDAIEWDIASLQSRLKNLDREARSVFRSDVPDYIVNAYKANKTQEINDQIETLTARYNMAAARYQNEWNNIKWQAEFWLKQQQLEMQKQEMALNDYYQRQWIALSWAELQAKYNWMEGGTANTVTGWTVQTSAVSREDIEMSVDTLVQQCIDWKLGKAQCAAGIQKYYLPYLWVDLGTLSKYSEKQAICTTTDKSYMPQKWDIVVMSSSSKPQNWHMGIVIWVEWDTLKYLDWNGTVEDGKGTETAKVRTIKLSSGSIYGYYNPTASQQQSWWYYNESFADIYSRFLQWELYTEWRLKTAVSSVWASSVDELREQAEAWKKAQSSNEAALMMLNAVEYLMSQWASKLQRQLAVNDGKETMGIWDIAWGIDRFFRWDAANYNSYFRYIKDNMTLDHLVELKNNWATFWALSNQELSAIGNAALAMSSDMWVDEFNTQLFTIYNKLRKNVWERTLTKWEFDKMIWAENSDKTGNRWNYLVLYAPEIMSEEPMEEEQF